MKVYNKSLVYTGTIVFAIGVYIDNTHSDMWVLGVVLMLLGAAMAAWAMKKPKNYQDPSDD